MQRAVPVIRIRHYAKLAVPFLTNDDWQVMVEAVEKVAEHAHAYTVQHLDPKDRSTNAFGEAFTRTQRTRYAARKDVAMWLPKTEPKRIVEMILGLTVMYAIEPHVIVSDDAFLVQVARACRSAVSRRRLETHAPASAAVRREIGDLLYEPVAMTALRAADAVRRQDEADRLARGRDRERDDDRVSAPPPAEPQQPRPIATLDDKLAGLEAWLGAQPCRQSIATLMALAQMHGLNFQDAQSWAMARGM